MNLESKTLEELESLLKLIKDGLAKPKLKATKLNGKAYLHLEKHTHCRTCGSLHIKAIELDKGEDTTTISSDNQVIVTTWKRSSKVIKLDSFTYSCSLCQARIKAWPRAQLEERLLILAKHNQEMVFGTARVPPFTFRAETSPLEQLCLNLNS